MLELFLRGGPLMYPLVLMALAVIALSIQSALSPSNSAHAVLFWGVLSLVTGFLGHFMGIYMATQAISRAGNVETVILAAGYGEALVPMLFGMWIFVVSALSWFTLRRRHASLFQG